MRKMVQRALDKYGDGKQALPILAAIEFTAAVHEQTHRDDETMTLPSEMLVAVAYWLDEEILPKYDKLIDKALESGQIVSYTCPRCGMKSYNANDAKHRYCGNCHQFEDDVRKTT